MASDNPVTVSVIHVEEYTFHIIGMKTRVRTGFQVAATLEVTGGSGGFGRGVETSYDYIVTVSHAGLTVPYGVWEKFPQVLSRATGIAETNIHIRPKSEE